jgi:amino acid adenylation domain-containing protein/non-ribosomal peptide synthase protein (TIGR01720 family)
MVAKKTFSNLFQDQNKRNEQSLSKSINNSFTRYPDKTIVELFEEQVLKTPENIAVVFEGDDGKTVQLTYKELNEQANILAHHLIDNYNIDPDDKVALLLDRSERMIVSILGVLKSGAAYVPISPDYPQERIDYILDKAEPKAVIDEEFLSSVILAQAGTSKTTPSPSVPPLPNEGECAGRNPSPSPVISPTAVIARERSGRGNLRVCNPDIAITPHNLAYIIFTSGTTGQPKGVQIEHHNVVRLLQQTNDYYKYSPNDVWTMFHSYTFDFSVWEIFVPLLHGSKLVVPSYYTTRDMNLFYNLVKNQKVTILNLTPLAFEQFSYVATNNDSELSLRHIIFGGDKLHLESVREWFDKFGDAQPVLTNMYGITETTVHVTYKKLTLTDVRENKGSLIGVPIADLTAYILDKNLNILPVGAIGELYIGGEGLSRGYLGDEKQTSEKFIPNPYQTAEQKANNNFNSRLYKTGDLARFLPDGSLDYLGRNDSQVQIRGFRVELGEIETKLNQYPGITTSVVIATNDLGKSESQLIAYYVPVIPASSPGATQPEIAASPLAPRNDGQADNSSASPSVIPAQAGIHNETANPINEQALRHHLEQTLPDYMVPAFLVQLEKLPFTINGKLDKKALPKPSATSRQKDIVMPATDTEKQIVEAFSIVLGVDKTVVSIDDNFFYLGGDSIKAIQLVNKIREFTGVQISFKQVFDNKTPKAIADYIGNENNQVQIIKETGILDGELKLLPIQKDLFRKADSGELPNFNHYNQSFAVALENIDEVLLQKSLVILFEYHDALRISFQRNGGSIIQQYTEPKDNIPYIKINKTNLTDEDLEEKLTQLQSSLDVFNNKLYQIALITNEDNILETSDNRHCEPQARQSQTHHSQRLLFIFHHLIIDAVSWRLIADNLKTIYQHLQKNYPSVIPAFSPGATQPEIAASPTAPRNDGQADNSSSPPSVIPASPSVIPAQAGIQPNAGINLAEKILGEKQTSYRNWSELISELPQTIDDQEKDYWNRINKEIPNYNQALAELKDTGVAREDTIEFSNEITEALLTKVNDKYNTNINDILLTALSRALQSITGQNTNFVALETHGRNEFRDDINLNKTVGWFTGEYPQILVSGNNPVETLIAQKEQVRKVANNGIAFGPLYGYDNLPKVVFNYLGQFNNAFGVSQNSEMRLRNEPAMTMEKPWSLTNDIKGVSISEDNKQTDLLIVNGAISDGKLMFSITSLLTDTHHKTFTAAFVETLENLVNTLSSLNRTYLTPSDTGNIVGIEELETLQKNDELEAIVKVNPLQEGFIYHAITQGNSDDAYIVQLSLQYDQALNVDVYKQAWENSIKRYPSLRLAFSWSNNLIQLVHKTANLNWTYIDLSNLVQAEQEQEISRITNEQRNTPFDLKIPGLFRIHIFKLSQESYRVLHTEHHSISDGWSNPVLLGYIHKTYLEILNGSEPEVIPRTTYIEAQKYIERNHQDAEDFFTNYLKLIDQREDLNNLVDSKESINLIDYKLITEPKDMDKSLDKELYAKLKEVAQVNGVTMNALLQYSWHKVLNIYGNTNTTTTGMTLSGRDLPIEDVEQSVGLYINTLPVILEHKENAKVIDLVKELQNSINDVSAHSNMSLAKLQTDGIRLFDSLFVFENYPISDELKNQDGLQVSLVNSIEKLDYPLSVIASESDTLNFTLKYAGELFSDTKIDELLNFMESILKQIVNNTDIETSKLVLVNTTQESELVNGYNDTRTPYPDKTIVQLFEEQVVKTPDNIAVVFEDIRLTYKELNEQANILAHHLIDHCNTKPDDKVALLLERSEKMEIAILGVLKSGAAYVPISPDYPQERISYILDKAEPKAVIDEAFLAGIDPSTASQDDTTSAAPNVAITPHNLAYVIFTSGTTGKPKGVQLEHKGLVNRIDWMNNEYGMRETDNVLQKTPYTFDVSVWEFIWPVLYGATLTFAKPEGHKDPEYIANTIYENGITIMHFVPSMLAGFEESITADSKLQGKTDSLRYIFASGEALQPKEVMNGRKLFKNAEIHNLYGPTEATIDVTYFDCNKDQDLKMIPIGKPIQNTTAYILDNNLNLVPKGAIGELYIGGDNLARGYLGDAKQTAEKFVPNPYQTSSEKDDGNYNSRIYKTGDLCRFLEDGNIEYIGRNDFQVKVRGFRIEVGEIESGLTKIDGIKDAVVIATDTEPKQLIAYYTNSPVIPAGTCCAVLRGSEGSAGISNEVTSPISEKYIREQLNAWLPEYMVPSYFIHLDKMPLSVNGKLDKKAFPKPDLANQNNEFVPPVTKVQKQVIDAFSTVLGTPKETISMDDNFFYLGGDSIKAIKLTNTLKNNYKLSISIPEIFQQKTPLNIAKFLDNSSETAIDIEPYNFNSPSEQVLSFAQERLWFLNQYNDRYSDALNAYNINMVVKLKTGENTKANSETNIWALNKAITDIVARHEVLSSVIKQDELGNTYQEKLDQDFQINEVSTSEPGEEIRKTTNYKFQLDKEFPIKVTYIKDTGEVTGKIETYLAMIVHHIAFDGWSVDVYINELAKLYEYYSNNEEVAASPTGPRNDAFKQYPLQPLPIQYKDFAIWQRNYLVGEVLDKQLDYWKTTLDGFETLNLPTDYKRPALVSYEGDNFHFDIDSKTTKRLKNYAKDKNISLFTLMLSIYYLMLRVYSNQDDIVVGSIIANRHIPKTEELLGFFVNSQALRLNFDGIDSFDELLNAVNELSLNAQMHQDLPFEKLIDALGVPKDQSRHPIFQVLFGLQNFGTETGDLSDVFEIYDNDSYKIAKYDLSFIISDNGETLSTRVEYATKLFEEETVKGYANTYLNLVKDIAKYVSKLATNQIGGQKITSKKGKNQKGDLRLCDIQLVSTTEKIELVNTLNDEPTPIPNNTVTELFEEQVEKTPNNIAVVFEDTKLTYKELNEQANILAHHLIDTYNIVPDDKIALILDRSEKIIISILAILKSGAAYVPISPEYPQERIDYILNKAQPKAVIDETFLSSTCHSCAPTCHSCEGRNPNTRSVISPTAVIARERSERGNLKVSNPDTATTPNNLAYIIFTSGTTGEPKGVQVEHKSIVNLVFNTNYCVVTPKSRILSPSSYVFDAVTFDYYISLTKGATLYITPGNNMALEVDKLADYIYDNSISHFFITTSLFNQLHFADPKKLSKLQNILFGGEAASPEDIYKFKKKNPSVMISNIYGPTETTTFALCYQDVNGDVLNQAPPIGKTLQNYTAYVLDKKLNLLPKGAIGELYIGGEGLARGYLDDNALTNAKFIKNPYQTRLHKAHNNYNYRIYKTGDLCRFLDDGNIEYLGRNDSQVKIRGFRIELEEIESKLLALDGISGAVVIATNDEPRQLVAYYVSDNNNNSSVIPASSPGATQPEIAASQAPRNDGQADNSSSSSSVIPAQAGIHNKTATPINEQALRQHLAKTLPEYMIPAFFIHLEKFPVTINGKLDKRALPEPKLITKQGQYIPPNTKTEQSVIEAFSKVLDIPVESISADDNFFYLGGNSIKVIKLTHILKNNYGLSLSVADAFAQNNPIDIAKHLDNNTATIKDIEPYDFNSPSEQVLSFAQERLWFLDKYENGTNAYNIPIIVTLSQDVGNGTKIWALNKAITDIVARHEVLSSVIKQDELGNTYQEKLDLDSQINEVSTSDPGEEIRKATNYIFQLDKEFPIKITYIKDTGEVTGNNETYLAIVVHHIAFDGWSVDVYINELAKLYEYYSNNEEVAASPTGPRNDAFKQYPLQPLQIQYKDYAIWQRNYLTGEVLNKQLDYWRKSLDGFETLNLPTDFDRPEQVSYEGSNYYFEIDTNTTASLKQLAKDKNISLYTLMLSIYYLMLRVYSNQDDIVVGSITANRHIPKTEELIGFFVNSQALRLDFGNINSLDELLNAVNELSTNAQIYQDLPFEKLVSELDVPQDQSRHPIFQVLFGLQNFGEDVQNLSEVFKPYENYKEKIAKYDLTFMISDDDLTLSVKVDYATKLFKVETIEGFADTYISLAKDLVLKADKNLELSNIEPVDDTQKNKLINMYNDNFTQYPDKTIVQLFEEQVEKTPDNIAVVFEDVQLTYRELNEQANILAHHLIDNYNIEPDDKVALLLDRSERMIISILGVLKSGAAYVPISPDYPQERIDYILNKAEPKAVIDEKFLTRINPVSVKNPLTVAITPQNLAYIIFTSGTTGEPKGVMVEHKGIVNLAFAQSKEFGTQASEAKVLGYANYVFDASVSEIFSSILFGATLYIASETLRLDPNALSTYIQDNNITIATIPPAILDPNNLYKLKTLIVAGESTPKDVMVAYTNFGTNIINAYGPTEVSVCSTLHHFDIGDSNNDIGHPIANTTSYILSSSMQLLPKGAIGELYIGGDGVARGYLNNEGLTNERFLPNPFQTTEQKLEGYNDKIYKTGDLVRYLDNGDLEYIGRNDSQVKIRGFRIELGEVESKLNQYPGITTSVVIATNDLGKMESQLVAYYVPEENSSITPASPSVIPAQAGIYNETANPIDEQALRQHLEQTLPDYMVPAFLVQLEKLPLTINGKLDKKALPKPSATGRQNSVIAPTTDTEKQVITAFSEVLGVDKTMVSIDDNFFYLGGDSIKAIQLVNKIREFTGVQLSFKQVFANKTPKAIADYIGNGNNQIQIIRETGILDGELKLLPIQKDLFKKADSGEVPNFNHYNQSFTVALENIDETLLQKALVILFEYHDALRMNFQRNGDVVTQRYTEPKDNIPYIKIDRTNLTDEDLEEKLTLLQGSLDVFNDKLYQIALISSENNTNQRLLFIFHHLIIDSVSWRLIADNLKTIYQYLENNSPSVIPALSPGATQPEIAASQAPRNDGQADNSSSLSSVIPAKAGIQPNAETSLAETILGEKQTSYRNWSELISELPQTIDNQEKDYWTNINKDVLNYNQTLAGLNATTDAREDTIEFSSEITEALLTKVNDKYNTNINDILLTALSRALQSITGQNTNFVALETHGRNEFRDDVSLNKTVGWFTGEYPQMLVTGENSLESLIAQKEQVRKVKNNGIAFGPLYGYDNLPKVVFNYLGQFDNTEAEQQAKPWSLTNDIKGESVSRDNKQTDLLSLNGAISRGKLMFSITSLLTDTHHETFTAVFMETLENLVNTLSNLNRTYLTPSDTDDIVDSKELETLQKESELETVLKANPLQEGFIYHAITQGESDDAYIVQLGLQYDQELDIDIYKQAWVNAIIKYPSMRLSFAWDNNMLQIVHKKADLDWTYIDLSDIDKVAQEQEIDKVTQAQRNTPFDLRMPGLFRLNIFKLSDTSYRVLHTGHHAIIDGWSNPILLGYIHNTYSNITSGFKTEIIPEIAYIESQKYIGANNQDAKDFFTNYLEQIEQREDLNNLVDSKENINLIDYKLITEPKNMEKSLDKELYAKLKEVSQANGVTMNALLQYSWHKVLNIYGNTDTTTTGMTVSGRDLPIDGIEQSVGLYINTLPVTLNHESNSKGTIKVLDFVKDLQNNINDVNAHSNISLANLQTDGVRLFDSLCVFENYPVSEEVKNQDVLQVSLVNSIEKLDYPLGLIANENDTLNFTLKYAGELFSDDKINELLNFVKSILQQIADNPNIKTSELVLVSPTQELEMITRYKDHRAQYPGTTIVQLFEEQVLKTPENIVVVFEGNNNETIQLTYKELNEQANILAHYLIDNYNTKPDDKIALLLDRSERMIISILGVLKSGAAYVPISPEYPKERIDYILDKAEPKAVIDEAFLSSVIPTQAGIPKTTPSPSVPPLPNEGECAGRNPSPSPVIARERSERGNLRVCNPETATTPQNLAYIIFTSGTTGQPKGVQIEHHNVVRLLQQTNDYYKYSPNDVWTMFHSYTFDFSVWEIFTPLLHGSKLIVPSYYTTRDMNLFYELVKNQKVTILNLTPLAFEQFSYVVTQTTPSPIGATPSERRGMDPRLREDDNKKANNNSATAITPSVIPAQAGIHNNSELSLRHIIFGGDKLHLDSVREWFDKFGDAQPVLTNMYGITETTVHVTYKKLTSTDVLENKGSLIGVPIADLTAYILDKNLNILPVGAVGELFIGGEGLSRGYLGDKKQTAEKFIPNPYQTEEQKANNNFNSKLYKTGDLACFLPDGSLDYLGRNDSQVQIRGFRVELGEIETKLNLFPGISTSVVIATNDLGKRESQLVAYYVPVIPASSLGATQPEIAASTSSPRNDGSANPIDEQALRQHLEQTLPDYMVPAFLVQLDKLPLTINGKLDKKALPKHGSSVQQKEFIEPVTEVQKQVIDAFSKVLDIPKETISIDDNFFYLGGDSIKVIRLTNTLKADCGFSLSVADAFAQKTPIDIAKHLESNDSSKSNIKPYNFNSTKDQIPSFAQERLWFLDKYENGTNAYNIPIILTLSPDVGNGTKIWALNKAIADIVARHEVLSSVIKQDELGSAYQEKLDLDFKISEVSTAQPEEEIRKATNYIFQLDKEFPIKVTYIKDTGEVSGNNETYLAIVVHHIAFDGWSVDVYINELVKLYEYYSNNEEVAASPTGPRNDAFKQYPLQPLPIQYKDFAIWQKNYLAGEVLEKQLSYWKKSLDGFETLNLPTDYERPKLLSYEGGSYCFTIDSKTTNALKQLAQVKNISLYTLMLSIYYLMLKLYSNQNDIVVGSFIANRHIPKTEELIGFFVNSQALRLDFDNINTLNELLRAVNEVSTNAQMYQDLPFEKLVEELDIPQDQSRHPIFQTMFGLQNFGEGIENLSNVFKLYKNETFKVAKYDLAFMVSDGGSILNVSEEYATKLFKEETIKGVANTYMTLAKEIASKVVTENNCHCEETKSTRQSQGLEKLTTIKENDCCIKDLDLSNIKAVDKEYEQELINKYNNSFTPQPDKTIVQLFEEQVETNPDNIAVVLEDSKFTYKELNEQANILAHHLIDNYNIEPDDKVALLLDRSEKMIVAILGILKSGAAYVPISPEYPKERIDYILGKVQPKAVIDEAFLSSVIARERSGRGNLKVCNPDTAITPHNLAYIIFTSGTTGQPKGVMIEHRSVVFYIRSLDDIIPKDELGINNITLITEYIFDIFGTELYYPLFNGLTLDIFVKEPDEFVKYIYDHKIDIIQAPPSKLKYLVPDISSLANNKFIKAILVGGEPLDENLANAIKTVLPDVKLHNIYGPTETTIYTTSKEYSLNGLANNIGKPLLNETAYILSESLQLLPNGAIGELYIGGVGLGRGYIGDEMQTNEKFIANPYQTTSQKEDNNYNSHIYKTGDLCRFLPNGDIEYMGRNDFQVKIRGFRIELGEVETRLSSIDGVNDAVVTATDDEPRQLIGYYVSNEVFDEKSLRRELKDLLPEYMIPSFFIHLKSLPITINGKLDRKALPKPDLSRAEREFIPLKTTIQIQIAGAFAKVLEIKQEQISLDDNFYLIGGNSLKTILLAKDLEVLFSKHFSVTDIYKNPTIEGIEKLVTSNQKTQDVVILNTGKEGTTPLFFIHPALVGAESYTDLAEVLDKDIIFYGINDYNQSHLGNHKETVEELALEYISQIKPIIGNQPIMLGGWSFGGVVAYEMAVQLTKIGIEVKNIFMLDSIFVRSVDDSESDEEVMNMVKNLINSKELFDHYVSIGIVDQYIKNNRLFNAIISKYNVKEYDGKITLFKCLIPEGKTPEWLIEDQTNGLGNNVQNLKTIDLDCKHSDIVRDPAMIRAIVDEIEATSLRHCEGGK